MAAIAPTPGNISLAGRIDNYMKEVARQAGPMDVDLREAETLLGLTDAELLPLMIGDREGIPPSVWKIGIALLIHMNDFLRGTDSETGLIPLDILAMLTKNR